MAFDKTIAMRNAERYLSQGKIRLAIGEYKQVVKHDPTDFGTTNMLGDLYAKSMETKEAIACYTAVAEHYSNQGFAAKAIAIYNKIAKIIPDSPEISKKLAELYVQKGSVKDARSHYIALAKSYEAKGRKIEALAIWKQIAHLDANNTEIYQTLGESFLAEGQNEDAVESFSLLGERLVKLGRNDEAIVAYEKALAIEGRSERALNGYLECMFAADRAAEAAARIEELRTSEPQDRDLSRLAIECYLRCGNTEEAEKAIIKLVEYEPSNYLMFTRLAQLQLEKNDTVAAARVLSMSSEHLLAGGQSEELQRSVTVLLEKDPDNIEGLRLLCDYCVWQRDETALLDSLKRLSTSARNANAVQDERFALIQLRMILPHETEYTERLSEINAEHGFDDEESSVSPANSGLAKKLFGNSVPSVVGAPLVAEPIAEAFEIRSVLNGPPINGVKGIPQTSEADFEVSTLSGFEVESARVLDDHFTVEPEDDEDRMKKEIDSIKFYVESGYIDLAEKAIAELVGDFGLRPDVQELRAFLDASRRDSSKTISANGEHKNGNGNGSSVSQTQRPEIFDINDLRSELGLEDTNQDSGSDYDTHYHTGIAYQEMGLLQEAIQEYQNAVSTVSNNDGTRRFFQCANLLGHCFMSIGKPHLALTWYQRTLDTNGLSDEEKQGLWYELANAFEADGDQENAAKYFEMVFAENINFRDVGERLKRMTIAA